MAGRKLKVFQAQFGFYDTIVAATSQAAALRAWGTHQDLFASGAAKPTTDPAAIAAAAAHPETPLRRAVGSADRFELQPSGLPEVPDASRVKVSLKPNGKAKPPAPAKRPADRSKLDAAEKALRQVEQTRKTEDAAFRVEEEDLAERMAAAQSAYVEARKAATAEVAAARTTYREAGGDEL
jgi:hypothetical protein